MQRISTISRIALTIAAAALFISCSGDSGKSEKNDLAALSGTVHIDGSSTVFPITEAVAEEFQRENTGVRVTVGISGTGGGFKKFSIGETDINDASRLIKSNEETKAAENQIGFIELPVAFDGISILVNPKNDWVDQMTVEELKMIWQPGSTVKKWNDVRSDWPDRPITLYGPGTDSGTFDYFTKAINGTERACRADFTASEDDNVLVQGIAGDENALGFFGFAYYIENQDKLQAVPIVTETGPVAPTETTINNGTYMPLSRPIFIYVSTVAARRPEVKSFVEFYLEHAKSLVSEVGYVALPDEAYDLATARFQNMTTGSAFRKTAPGMSVVDILKGTQ